MLGSGSFSVVYPCEDSDEDDVETIDTGQDRRHHQDWCEKRFQSIIVGSTRRNTPDHDAFFRELTYLVYLNRVDPGLTPRIDLQRTQVDVNGSTAITMERFEGDLTDFIGQGTWVSRRARIALFRSLCVLVDRLHKARVIHGDLKPANILWRYSKDPTVKDHHLVLCDFGISLLARDQHLCHDIQTETYRAPELYRLGLARAKRSLHKENPGSPSTTLWSAKELIQAELYSLGICGLELFGNFSVYRDIAKVKHVDESIQSTLKRLGYFDGKPEFQHWLPQSRWNRTHPTIRSLVLDLLHPDPQKRPSLSRVIGIVDDILAMPAEIDRFAEHPEAEDPASSTIDPRAQRQKRPEADERPDSDTSTEETESETDSQPETQSDDDPLDSMLAVEAVEDLLERLFVNPITIHRFVKTVDQDRMLRLVPSAPMILFMDLCRLFLSVILVRPEGSLLPDKAERLLLHWPVRPSYGIVLDRLLDMVKNADQAEEIVKILL